MAAHGVTQIRASTTGLPTGEEVQEYEKILRISDEIFSGTHPKLKVPHQFVRKTTSRNPAYPSSIQAQVVKTGGLGGSPTERSSQATPSAAPASTTVDGTSDVITTTPSKNRTVPKSTSEIDPIFLTKSDDLVRAELQLQRQRVERVLRDQLEQKRLESRQKAAVQDAKPDFDVSGVLNQALELVKPASVNDISASNVVGAPSDSFDENSFYSSRAPDSPQQGEPSSAATAPHTGDLPTKIPVENYSDELQRLEALNRTGLDQEMRDAYPVADKRDPYRHRQPHDAPVDLTGNKYHQLPQADDAMEEPDYSPPAPSVPPMDRAEVREYQPEYITHDARRRVDNRAGAGGYYNTMSPRDDVRVVRNHITSPAAPQPSRVSPLAVAKVPSAPQAKDIRTRYEAERVHPTQGLDRASPDAPAAQHPIPRKRRRLQEDKGRARQVPYNKKPAAVDTSDPYIKEEPVSPPPFADALPAYQGRPAQPVYIDIASPRYTPVVERREPPIREPVYEADPYHEAPMSRAASRLSSRRPMRDEPDLRRVASLQNARQPEYAREYVEQQPSPRAVRAASYAVVERPPPERATRYYDEPVPAYSRRFIPAEGSPSSPQSREAYYEEEPVPARIMAPPRRVVVDEHGNQYYEAASAVQYVSSAGRIPRNDVYDDDVPVRQASVRQASMRATSVIEDPYGGRKYVQEMPPPPSTYRRVTDYARPAPAERRSYATPLEGEPFPRSSSVQVGEYARRPAYMDDPGLPRERLMRVPSVRPQTARYDEPREVISRVASVRPGSVYMDEDPQRPREYVERPVYVSRPPPMREDQGYYEGEPERVMMEGGRNVVQRAPPRY